VLSEIRVEASVVRFLMRTADAAIGSMAQRTLVEYGKLLSLQITLQWQ
jgi:hypothetical protein